MAGVSVIIPLFNRERYIAEAIQSVLDQEFIGTLEIIVSDDGSTDLGVDIALSFGFPVRVLLKPKSCSDQGVSGARNRGLLAATQDYISFLDSDDYYLPGHLNKMAASMEENPQYGFIFSRMQELKEINGDRIIIPWTRSKVTALDITYPILSGPKVLHTNCLFFKEEVFKTVGFFNQNYTSCEDTDMWMRVSEQYKGLFSDHLGAVYRTEHDAGQLTANNAAKMRETMLKNYVSALERYRSCTPYDDCREFLIEHNIAGIKFSRHRRFRYYVELLKLMIKHPKVFILKSCDYFYKM